MLARHTKRVALITNFLTKAMRHNNKQLANALLPLIDAIKHKRPDVWESSFNLGYQVELSLTIGELREIILATYTLPAIQERLKEHKLRVTDCPEVLKELTDSARRNPGYVGKVKLKRKGGYDPATKVWVGRRCLYTLMGTRKSVEAVVEEVYQNGRVRIRIAEGKAKGENRELHPSHLSWLKDKPVEVCERDTEGGWSKGQIISNAQDANIHGGGEQ